MDYAILRVIVRYSAFMTNKTPQNNNDEPQSDGGILDTIMETEHTAALADFSPDQLAAEALAALKERDRNILCMRYGLADHKQHTLDAIGKKLGLTRERVRQVEKEGLKNLQPKIAEATQKSMDVVKKTISDHGGIFAQHALVDHLLISSDKSDRQVNALIFLLDLMDGFHLFEEGDEYHRAWHVSDFKVSNLDDFHKEIKIILERSGSPIKLGELKNQFQSSAHYNSNQNYFTARTIENLLQIIKHVRPNPFGEYGLRHWRVIQPRDVGDKAYLVLAHHKQPEHYTKITEMINRHKFDSRTAYKETVHNELIMDPRFVLVGRGIYALSDWGYKKGLVSDVIKQVLEEANEPLERNKIMEEVLKRRMVKRNTVLVGLTNKKLFRKIGKSKYTLA